jgi:hypothetical protein
MAAGQWEGHATCACHHDEFIWPSCCPCCQHSCNEADCTAPPTPIRQLHWCLVSVSSKFSLLISSTRSSGPLTPRSPLISRSANSLSLPPIQLTTPPLVMSVPNGQLYRRPSSLERRPSRSGDEAKSRRISLTLTLDKRDPYASPDIYYGDEDAFRKQFLGWNNRAVSSVGRLFRPDTILLQRTDISRLSIPRSIADSLP